MSANDVVLYTVVKFASEIYWKHFFNTDPRLTGVKKEDSSHDTYTGKQLKLKDTYTSLSEAQLDADKANQSNPCGYYAVCHIID